MSKKLTIKDMVKKVNGKDKLSDVWHEFRSKEIGLQELMLQLWHNPAGYSLPVFLLGCGRSGTTMLVQQLNKSWQVKLYNEDHPAAFQNWTLRDLNTIEELIGRSFAPVTLFKPILDTYRARILLSGFPEAKVLFAFRHYEDVINSLLRFEKKRKMRKRLSLVESWIIEDFEQFSLAPLPERTKDFIKIRWNNSLSQESGAALWWLFYNSLFFDLELHLDKRVKIVHYGSVVSEPQKEFRKLCSFIDIQFEISMIEGIYSSSVKRYPAPEIDHQIREDCRILWQRLRDLAAQA
ncbi:MAG: sulfotransferase domain-containing protein [Anaerolineales bacterium]|jgi:hypothetical protein